MPAPDLDAIYTARFAELAANGATDSATAVARQRDSAAAIAQNAANYAAIDQRLVTGAIAAQIAAAGNPDAFAGLNAGSRMPVTLSQPSSGAAPAAPHA